MKNSFAISSHAAKEQRMLPWNKLNLKSYYKRGNKHIRKDRLLFLSIRVRSSWMVIAVIYTHSNELYSNLSCTPIKCPITLQKCIRPTWELGSPSFLAPMIAIPTKPNCVKAKSFCVICPTLLDAAEWKPLTVPIDCRPLKLSNHKKAHEKNNNKAIHNYLICVIRL